MRNWLRDYVGGIVFIGVPLIINYGFLISPDVNDLWLVSLSFGVSLLGLFLLLNSKKKELFNSANEYKTGVFWFIVNIFITSKYSIFMVIGIANQEKIIYTMSGIDNFLVGITFMVVPLILFFKGFRFGKEKEIWRNKDIENEIFNVVLGICFFLLGLRLFFHSFTIFDYLGKGIRYFELYI